MAMRTIQRDIVGAVIISSDNKVVLGQHAPEDQRVYPGQWIVPGGGIENGESELEALQREMLEEVTIDITSYKAIKVGVDKGLSQKKLADSGEVVNVEMVFNDYLIKISDKTAQELGSEPTEEFKKIRWFSSDELPLQEIAEPTIRFLRAVKFIQQ